MPNHRESIFLHATPPDFCPRRIFGFFGSPLSVKKYRAQRRTAWPSDLGADDAVGGVYSVMRCRSSGQPLPKALRQIDGALIM